MPSKNNLTVDVIIPTYNTAHYLGYALDSVFSQTHPVTKIIIIDDGSEDGTEQLVSRYKASSPAQIDFVKFPKNTGISHARNEGFNRSQADIVMFLDTDDVWDVEKVRMHLERLEEKPEAILSYCNFKYIDDVGKPRGDIVSYFDHRIREGNVFKQLLLTNLWLRNPGQIAVRRSAIELVGRFDEQLPAAEDWDFMLRLAKTGEFVQINVPLLYIRYHSSNVTRRAVWLFEAVLGLYDKWAAEASLLTAILWGGQVMNKVRKADPETRKILMAILRNKLRPASRLKMFAFSAGNLRIALIFGYIFGGAKYVYGKLAQVRKKYVV
ncbi:MAG: glycosyltransferase [Patescibacteria group bacterium]